ncbi:GEVED domain-containing protein, partial [uncultured Porphyromonas sp.]
DGPHRVRVMMSLDGAPSPQKIVVNGEVEDYAIIVK